MNSIDFAKLVLQKFPYKPTKEQVSLINNLSQFTHNKGDNKVFILKGYAGTGKTTVVSTFVKSLNLTGRSSVLLAPTGRAAKVLSSYSGQPAQTIHKKLYFISTSMEGNIRIVPSKNKHTDTIFMVDEASMIPDTTVSPEHSLFSRHSLLEDLLSYVLEGKNCKVILIGDTAQLPPVGLSISPALNIESIRSITNSQVYTFELKEVVRQSQESGILTNATIIRNRIKNKKADITFNLSNTTDVIRITGEELEDFLNQAYSASGQEETMIITRSNKRANIFNREIRNRILFIENIISAGDYLMVVKNNYFWLDKKSGPGFIANGDIVEVLRIEKYEDHYGFRFADITLRLLDYPEEKDISVKIILDTLDVDGPSLTYKDRQLMFEEIMKDYEDIPSRRARFAKVKNNPFYNALQVKFAYALTCHKTQGGQWENIFIDQGYFREDDLNTEYQRWLYTAVTRATKKLYLVNFHSSFF